MDDPGYTMDVDDLFGDSEQVSMPTLTAPPVKGLPRRLDELSANGCCQKIAWSKSGCVAYIAPDGYAVNLRVFSRDPTTGKWDLSEDTPLEIPHGHDDFPYVHLSWSYLGQDLAVVDAAGHVLLFSPQMVLDKMGLQRIDSSHPDAEMDAVVGMHWLAIVPFEQKNQIVWSATGKGNVWSFNSTPHVFQDAHHPVDGKTALIYLKRYGEVRLRFQHPDGIWYEVTATLGPVVSTREAFSHAAFASNGDNTLLLTAYDVSGRLHLYRIEMKWNVPPKSNQPTRQLGKPEILVTEISTQDACYPVSSADMDGNLSDNPSSKIRIPAQLTHLHFLPKTPEQKDGTLPTIQAIFSTPPNFVSLDQTQAHQNPWSIVVRWEVHRMQKSLLHSSLDQVTSKKKSVSSVPPREVFVLKSLPDIVLHSVVLAFYPLWYSMINAYCYSDGTIEFRKRASMEAIVPDYNTQSVASLSQAGFVFSNIEPFLHIALSPSHCMAATMQPGGTVKVRSMEYTYGSLSTDDDHDPKHSAALAALVLQFSSAVNQYFSTDDIFAVLGSLSENRKLELFQLMFQGLKVNMDCGADDSPISPVILLNRAHFFKTLSVMHVLGLNGLSDRSVQSKMAWMFLNIKYITWTLMQFVQLHQPIEKTPIRADFVACCVGICRWALHFMVYIVDEVFTVGFALKELPQESLDRASIESKITSLNKPAILLLLSGFPRSLMRNWIQPLIWIMRSSFAVPNQQGTTIESRRIYAPLQEVFNDSPFDRDWRVFEALLQEAHMLVRQLYKRANLSDVQRDLAERDLLLGRLPDVLVPAAKRMLTDTLFNSDQPNGCLIDKLDYAKMHFFDTVWLGLTASKTATKWHSAHVVDESQKTVIRGTGAQAPSGPNMPTPNSSGSGSAGGVAIEDGLVRKNLRRCTRCGAYMENVVHGIPGYGPWHVRWLTQAAKHCVCGNAWMLSEWVTKAK